MKVDLLNHTLEKPINLKEALKYLNGDKKDSIYPLAGGTDLMVKFNEGGLPPGVYLDLGGLKELKGIFTEPNEVMIGSLTSFSDLIDNKYIKKHYPLLVAAASEIGGPAIQNQGTIGGNIMNASPAADSPPVLLVYEAKVKIYSLDGDRVAEFKDFYLDYKKTLCKKNELLGSIIIPKPKSSAKCYFRKVGPRQAMAISKTILAGLAEMDKGKIKSIRLAAGSLAPTVVRLYNTENIINNSKITPALIKRARAELQSELKPIDDLRSTAKYRLEVTGNLLEEFLLTLR